MRALISSFLPTAFFFVPLFLTIGTLSLKVCWIEEILLQTSFTLPILVIAAQLFFEANLIRSDFKWFKIPIINEFHLYFWRAVWNVKTTSFSSVNFSTQRFIKGDVSTTPTLFISTFLSIMMWSISVDELSETRVCSITNWFKFRVSDYLRTWCHFCYFKEDLYSNPLTISPSLQVVGCQWTRSTTLISGKYMVIRRPITKNTYSFASDAICHAYVFYATVYVVELH